jgi:hypothetical protein
VYVILVGEVQGRRLPGRPRIRWIDSVNEVMQSTGLREADWEDRIGGGSLSRQWTEFGLRCHGSK